ncbi:SWIM zinc finger family protein [Tsukamurella soli]|uniref:SWIM zinc finger family protein n=1 Tax=Tsukamurella soli TaxID=644556 RepID=A0ABP8JSS6_9ACTN
MSPSRGGGWYPPASKPRAVQGGLAARSRRGAISQTWWSERFIAVLEGMGMGSRLQRGKAYARKGQVVSLDIAPGAVDAAVQGSRARPYRVRIGIAAFGKEQWRRVEQHLAENAWYAAKLLAGEMPDDIEELFAAVGLSLFPARANDLTLDCSCPDFAVPCKHLAAVFYLLAEAFDDDPFAILAWRGREREDLLDNVRAARGGVDEAEAADRATPLEDLLDRFYERVAPVHLPAASVAVPTALLDQLPGVDVTVRGASLVDVLRPLYLALGAADDPAEAADPDEPAPSADP